MSKKGTKRMVKVVGRAPRQKTTLEKENTEMIDEPTTQQPPETSGQATKPSSKALDEWAKEAQKWMTVAEDKKLKELADKIVPHIKYSPKESSLMKLKKSFLVHYYLAPYFN